MALTPRLNQSEAETVQGYPQRLAQVRPFAPPSSDHRPRDLLPLLLIFLTRASPAVFLKDLLVRSLMTCLFHAPGGRINSRGLSVVTGDC